MSWCGTINNAEQLMVKGQVAATPIVITHRVKFGFLVEFS